MAASRGITVFADDINAYLLVLNWMLTYLSMAVSLMPVILIHTLFQLELATCRRKVAHVLVSYKIPLQMNKLYKKNEAQKQQ